MKRYSVSFEHTSKLEERFSKTETGFVILDESNCKASFMTYFGDNTCTISLRGMTPGITYDDMARMAKAVAGRLLEGE